MSGLLPAAVYGLEVPAGDVAVPAVPDFPASFRITMAALDPSAEPEHTGTATISGPPRATLKLIRQPYGNDDDGDSEDEEDADDLLNGLLEGDDSDDESSSDEETNGGPSDPSKSKKARKAAAVEQLKKALAEDISDDDDEDDMEVDGVNGVKGVNGAVIKSKKGKAKATEEDGDDGDEDEDDEEDFEIEEFVICTLDPEKNYQQTLDITIGEDERVFFKVSGTHTIYLTGNYVIPADDGHNHRHEIYDDDDDEEGYDLTPDDEEYDYDDEENDELDALKDPRVTEVESEEEAPKLIKAEKQSKKGKNKRVADDTDGEPAGLDEIMAKSLKPEEPATPVEAKLSKKQAKKLKNNAGEPVPKTDPASTESPGNKKVQFAKELEQGPASSTKDIKPESKTNSEKPKASLGVKTVQGVKLDDKKLGKGPAAKKGDKVGMRYIGKLADGKVFDANKKGKPFSFKLGAGEVIKGWDIGVAGMSVGGERRIIIPASLAYAGKAQAGIPANSQLTFDLKLLEIN